MSFSAWFETSHSLSYDLNSSRCIAPPPATPQASRLHARLREVAAASRDPYDLLRLGESLEARGEYLSAAEMYKRMLDMHFERPSEGLLVCPPIEFANLGAS